MLLAHLILAVLTGILFAAIALIGGWSLLWGLAMYSLGGSFGLILSVSAVLLRDAMRPRS
ncbi:hypothetical protein [uncultured Jannaschia sp.]|uniref:hypothetical protein n=1 Tax=uncultured Jannaschia sp. TaxID=293347 RepID=UPI00261A7841|nr:hypothetical protein [uncultured Jannaschia sp.]